MRRNEARPAGIDRRAFLRALACGAAAGLAPGTLGAQQVPAVDSAGPVSFFRIGTGGAGGTYFPIGRLLASAVSSPPGARPCDKGGSCGVPGLIAVAQATQGSVENISLLAAKRIESGLCQADIAHWAYAGTGLYQAKGPMGGLRAIAGLFREAVHVVVRRDSRIQSIDDLKGKRVSIGEEASGTRVDAILILAAHGVQEKDIEAQYLRTGAAADALRDGSIDAFFFIAGYPVSAIGDLATRLPIRLLPVVGPPVELLRGSSPFFVEAIIPNQTYQDVTALPTLSVAAVWIIGADAPEALVYGITKAMWHPSARKLFESGHPEARNILIENARTGVTIPFHPGAQAYYAEVGIGR
ncbi:MAG: TAXI family TRAP transporter solute-binding subunit [Alphaproteobacteria bacterium]|nr:TAXI family TRAP transporter solute-binding subunit [Alphaproteobacteria bacterium]